ALIRNHPADLYVSVHPLANSFLLRALGNERPPFVTVVTDLVTTHALWYDRRADLILLPTELARQRALAYGMAPERLRVVGQPIAERYAAPPGDKRALRRKLGWPEEGMIVLTVGGGEGMGPLGETARAIAASGLNLCLIVVAGRNEKLRAELEAEAWPIPTRIYGFTRQMPEFMRAADVLVTKAGPGTIAEAMAAGLPLILYARLPGQEDGNVVYVLRKRAGVWAPRPDRVVRTLRRWVENPAARARVAENSRRAARPRASRAIARTLGALLGLVEEAPQP
ncbi:MAG: glycosyltransferase, partial [Anaerolineae bacterium]